MTMRWKRLLATGFGSGYLPIGPGSWGTFPGMLLYGVLYPLPWPIYLLSLLVMFVWAVPIATAVARDMGKKDPKCIVIDEIIAFPLTMLWIVPSLGTLLLGFFLNRLMDTIKIWPCRSLERLPDGWGIMTDDLMAAVYSCALMHLCLHYWPQIQSYHL